MTVIAVTDYPFLNIFWTILIFFAWVAWIWIAITVLIDLFRRNDLSGWAKAAWVIFVIVLPFLGVLAYLIVNHEGMAERSGKEVAASQAQFDMVASHIDRLLRIILIEGNGRHGTLALGIQYGGR